MIDSATIQRAVQMLLEASPPGSEVFLFGSHARGDARGTSDLDFLIIEPGAVNHIRESARLDRVLHPLRLPADILVISRVMFQDWKDTPKTVIYQAAREGKAFREMA
jgi:predicted nucleotidyltransferase